MVIPQGVIESIDTNNVEISSGWLWCSIDVYSVDYNTVLSQPISVEAVVLNELRFMDETATLTIRRTTSATSTVLWSGDIITEEDPRTVDHVVDVPSVAIGTAAEDIAMDSLVGLTLAGLVRADAELSIEAVGMALNSGAAGESVRYSPTGKIVALTVPFLPGTELYTGTSGNLTATPTTGLAQRVGTATPPGATISVQQPIRLET